MEKRKTGQHVDALKVKVVIPTVADIISELLPSTPNNIALLDIGPGDGTSTALLIGELLTRTISVKQLTLVETDRRIFGELLDALVNIQELTNIPITFMEPELAVIFGPLLEAYEDTFAIANAQMIFHQIENPAVIALYFAKTYMAIRDSGHLLITDLHPKFLEYLLVSEPDKLMTVSPGRYRYAYDSGGEQLVIQHAIVDLAAIGLSTGFIPVNARNHDLSAITTVKPRYKKLHDSKIPMVYTLSLQKQPNMFLSYSEGKVRDIEHKHNWMSVTFQDNTTREIPFPESVNLQPDDYMVIFQTKHPKDKEKIITNVWSYPEGGILQAKQYSTISYLK